MNVRIAVDLAGRGLKDLGFDALGETQHIDRAMHTGLQSLHWIELVVDRRCRARQIVNLIDLDIERQRNITAHNLETPIGQQMFDVLPPAGIKIVDAEHLVAVGKKPFAEMRADKSGTSGDKRSYSGKAHRNFPILLPMQGVGRRGPRTLARARNQAKRAGLQLFAEAARPGVKKASHPDFYVDIIAPDLKPRQKVRP